MRLTNWKARRAGGRITITGTDADSGQPAKIVGVDVIEPRYFELDGISVWRVIATDKYDTDHVLEIAPTR